MTLPIMVFAPNLLRPQLGYIFDVDWVEPYESLVGILWKYVKMNSFATPWLVEQIINSALPVDPYAARLSATDIDCVHAAKLIGIPLKIVQNGVAKSGGMRKRSDVLRWCPQCMAHGYHGIVHQYEDVIQCPVHAERLHSTCARCGHTNAYHLSVVLLESAFKCPTCGNRYAFQDRSNPCFRRRFDQAARIALTRCALGLPLYPKRPKRRRR